MICINLPKYLLVLSFCSDDSKFLLTYSVVVYKQITQIETMFAEVTLLLISDGRKRLFSVVFSGEAKSEKREVPTWYLFLPYCRASS